MLAAEILANVLQATPAPTSRVKYEYRRYADQVIAELAKASVELVSSPKVVRLQLRSTRSLREAAGRAWSKRLDETGDRILAFEAALRVTLELQRRWSLRDAVAHTLRFVVPESSGR